MGGKIVYDEAWDETVLLYRPGLVSGEKSEIFEE